MTNLYPLNAYLTLPVQLTYSTPKGNQQSNGKPQFLAEPENLETWLQTLEIQFPDNYVRVQVRAHPDDSSVHDLDHLDQRILRETLERATEALAKQIAYRKRGFFDAVFRLDRRGNAISLNSWLEPRIKSGPGARLMKRLDMTANQEEANRILTEFWAPRLSWLRRSGIEVLESRCNLNPMLWH